ncbi:TMV resistance protein N [Neltuma alba]|uniref:TMV resistance protein N n=1 Tax=Neltuma alba TaxID=207710 RepID=UPI0010A38CEF|nr:TMV resistance protein N-like [Prosopis alba]
MTGESPFSPSFPHGWTYDIFLNFRGEDSRFDFARNLYEALQQKGIHTFLDNERLRKGEKIAPSLLKAIQESRMAITIFSRNYASSTFCLDELVQIIEYINKKGRLVLPIFYDVDPSEVRHQRKNYREVFAQHERWLRNDKEKVQKWRRALQDVANLSGFHFKPGDQYEYAFIKEIVKEVTRKMNRKPLHIADYPVGLEYRVQKVNSLLDVESSEGVQMVGICGTGGIGKSTIARAVCSLIVDSFEGFCFLADVRENSINHGLVYLQEILLSEMLEEDVKLRDVNKGIPIIKHRLHKKKVLLVLDDVDKLKQLQAIAGGLDWFGSGSRIIVTTRDKHLLVSHGVERIYEVDFLNREEGLELLKWHAFKQIRVDASYMDILNNVVFYACGLPLALEVIGSNLFSREINYWNSALESFHSIPIREIQRILKVSYDALEEYEQEIFLDIACCFKGDSFEYVRSALYARGICPDYGVKVLIDKCLIKINHGKVTMHDLIQAMGKEIVRQKSPYEPGKRTRLWFHKDILNVLEENKGSGKIEAINLDMPGDMVIDWSGKAFKKMRNLKILIIRNAQFSTGPNYLPNSLRVLDWKGYPCPSLPSDFNPRELIILKMPESFLKRDVLLKKFQSLSVLNFKGCKFLRRVSDLSAVPDLRELCLEGCNKLTEVHVSIGFLSKLKRLSVKHCKKLKAFPSIKLTSLEFLDLSGCSSLTRFPEILGMMENIKDVCLDHSGIEELPLSFKNLVNLEKLKLSFCRSIEKIGGIPPKLKELSAINLDWYSHLSLESRSILLSQALHEVDGLKFIVEEDKTPEWFDHYVEGDSWSFWFQKEFPNMAVCFGALIEDQWHTPPKLLIDVRVNGTDVGFPEGQTIFAPLTTPHVFLFDLRGLIVEDKLKYVVSEREWNHVEISCVLSYIKCYQPGVLNGIYGIAGAKWCGVYVYKQKSRMEHIRFINHSHKADPELFKGSSLNPDSFAKLVLRQMEWPHVNFKVIQYNCHNAVMSLLSKPITELRKRQRDRRDQRSINMGPTSSHTFSSLSPLDEKG